MIGLLWANFKARKHDARHGAPLSFLHYVLCKKNLVNLIRRYPKMLGFLLPASCGLQAKFSLYANDTTLLLKERFVNLTDLFEKGTGANLNRSQNGEAHGLTWVCKMKILTVPFLAVDTEHDNWQPKWSKLVKSLNHWNSRSAAIS